MSPFLPLPGPQLLVRSVDWLFVQLDCPCAVCIILELADFGQPGSELKNAPTFFRATKVCQALMYVCRLSEA